MHEQPQQRPRIVCLCGSTRFGRAFRYANLRETLAGNIVLTIGCDMRSDGELFDHLSEQERADIKQRLDALHLCKIDLADEVLILNVEHYIGPSTARELAYAKAQGKTIRYLEEIGKRKPVSPETWREQWPNHCKICHGAGMFVDYYDPSPSGIAMGAGSMESIELCSCTEHGLCARCMRLGLSCEDRGDSSTGEGPCLFCGWNYNDQEPQRAHTARWEESL